MNAPIRIRGARENNLKDVSVEIPAGAITVFVGVSGSGKSSLVFDTLAAEARRQLNATFPWSLRNQLPAYERPDVDAVEQLTTPVVVDQNPLGGNARSTVGTITDIHGALRSLFSAHGDPDPGPVSLYSFNEPAGMCPECDGLGRTVRPDPDLMLDREKSLDEGAILLPGFPPGGPMVTFYTHHEQLDPGKKIKDYSPVELHTFLYGNEGHVESVTTSGKVQRFRYEGLVLLFTRRNLKVDDGARSAKSKAAAERFIREGTCPACAGARLNPAALSARVAGRSIAEWNDLQVTDLIGVCDELEGTPAGPMAAAIATALRQIEGIGLGYLNLGRATTTLSGGEGQRIKLVKHLASDLTAMTYIFDEPSTGLHPRDVGRLNDLLLALRDKGNTVVVVEHDPDVIEVADHVVEVGPRAGAHGGEIVFRGGYAELLAADTLTGRAVTRRRQVRTEVRTATGQLPLRGVTLHNLRNVSVDVPTGVLTVVTGVAGSGKSSLIAGAFLDRYPDTVLVDQAPIATSSRSTPATYLGMMDPIRKLFAKASGADAGLFSFNSAGACEECQGRGLLVTELAYMDPITSRCGTCEGRRFKDEVLAHTLRDRSIVDVLGMSAEEAHAFFTEKPVRTRIGALLETGLGYLGLGQSLSTLSGGERQRIKLADRLGARDRAVYVLDEPTSGLHLSDVDMLLGLLDGLVDRGNTVVVIEHDLAVVQHADWVIDLGPDGGRAGGEIVFTGTPEKLLTAENSLTGEYLARYQRAV